MRVSTGEYQPEEMRLDDRATGQDAAGPAEEDLIAASAALAEALRGGDGETLARLTDADFTWVDESGQVRSRRDVIVGKRSGSETGETSRSVRDYGSVAMVTGRTRRAGEGERVALDVWVKTGEGWRALIRHLNVLADPD